MDDAAAAERALRMHAYYRGKIAIVSKVPLRGTGELAIWFTLGVAEHCRAIAADIDASFTYTNRANTIAIVSDGSRVLGLGDIGPEAGLPVMEGKALHFKLFGGVDATRARHCASSICPTFGSAFSSTLSLAALFCLVHRLRSHCSPGS